jgi:hypothetical protein
MHTHHSPNNIHKLHIEDKSKDKTTYQNKKAFYKIGLKYDSFAGRLLK